MTIHYPKRFREAQPCGFDGVFDWDFLKPAWAGTSCEPMDFDCVVERNHRFLVFETKDAGVSIPRGQEICLQRAVMTGRFTIIVIRGKTKFDIEDDFEIWRLLRNGALIKQCMQGGYEGILRCATRWFNWASKIEVSDAIYRFHYERDMRSLPPCRTCGQGVP